MTTKKKVTKKLNLKLPNKLSDLIDLAVTDLTAVERLKRYKVNMDDWHVPATESASKKCEVCFAGSVMARTCKLNPGDYGCGIIVDSGDAVSSKMYALNSARIGNVTEALSSISKSVAAFHKADDVLRTHGIEDFVATDYEKIQQLSSPKCAV